jgi:hypothetical protein
MLLQLKPCNTLQNTLKAQILLCVEEVNSLKAQIEAKTLEAFQNELLFGWTLRDELL